jgi:hypothetical protein
MNDSTLKSLREGKQLAQVVLTIAEAAEPNGRTVLVALAYALVIHEVAHRKPCVPDSEHRKRFLDVIDGVLNEVERAKAIL